MREISILIMIILFMPFSSVAISEDDTSERSRSLSFVDIGDTSFDQTSAPTFISAADWNNDGYDDLLFNGFRLFRNSGPPDFDFTYMGSVFNGTVSGSSNGVWADWDGDGDQDLYQGCRKGINDRFWENQGSPDFILEDISSEVFGSYQNPGPNMGNSWCDFDLDGDLDLYVGNGEDWNDGNPIYYDDFMLRNEGGTSFIDVTGQIGMRTGDKYYSRGATWGDHDNNRWPDLYVSHYRIRENHLFVNQNGFFTEKGVEKNCSGTYDTTWYEDREAGSVYGQTMWGPTWGHTIGSSWADFNRDGNLDLWTSDFVHKYVGYIGSWYDIRGYVCDDGNLYINDGAPHYTFTDYRNNSGIPIWPIGGSGTYQGDQTFAGVSIGDFDNDGWEDMYIPQVYGDLPYTTPHLFRNKGYVTDGSAPNGTTFKDITTEMGIKGANTYACLFFDRDNDGDLDIVTGGADTWSGSDWSNYRVRMFDNQGTDENRFLRVKLNGTGMNRDAIGARVTIRFDGPQGNKQILTREVRAGTGHAHQQSNTLHFGLGSDIDPEMMDLFSIEVRWPDGNIQWIKVDKADTTIFVDQPIAGAFPDVQSISISPSQPEEDEPLTITVDALSTHQEIAYYLWDLDLDNHFDKQTLTNSITITRSSSDVDHVRCYVVSYSVFEGGHYIAEAYPIEFQVQNIAPEISIQPMEGPMDSMLIPADYSMIDTPSDLRNLTWNISWGDDNFDVGTGETLPGHVFTRPGEFDIELSVSDEEYTIKTETKALIYNVAPSGWIEVLPSGKEVFTEDIWVEFHPHVIDTPSDNEGHELVWVTDTGKRIVGEENESLFLKFGESGRKNLSLEITDRYDGKVIVETSIIIENDPPLLVLKDGEVPELSGEEDSQIRFDMLEGFDNETDMRAGFNYTWDFGDGTVSDPLKNPIVHHTYVNQGEYLAVCRMTDIDGATTSYQINVHIDNPSPVLTSMGIEDSYGEDEEISFKYAEYTDTRSDRDSLIISLETNGISYVNMTGDHPIIKFFHSGTYDVTMTVTDDNGDLASLTKTVEIVNTEPIASMSGIPRSIEEDSYYKVEARDLYDTPSDLRNLSIEWKITDTPGRLTGEEITLHFEGSGTKMVTLIVSDGDSTIFIEKSFRVINPTPVASFEIRDDLGRYFPGEWMIFDASKTTDNPSDMDDLRYEWDMGDGENRDGVIINHSYQNAGVYHVTLKVTDDDGDYYMTSADVEVIVDLEKIVSEEPDNFWLKILVLSGLFIIILMGAILIATWIHRRGKEETGGDLQSSGEKILQNLPPQDRPSIPPMSRESPGNQP